MVRDIRYIITHKIVLSFQTKNKTGENEGKYFVDNIPKSIDIEATNSLEPIVK